MALTYFDTVAWKSYTQSTQHSLHDWAKQAERQNKILEQQNQILDAMARQMERQNDLLEQMAETPVQMAKGK